VWVIQLNGVIVDMRMMPRALQEQAYQLGLIPVCRRRAEIPMARRDAAARRPFVGRWRITDMELWTVEDLDLLGPARLTLARDGCGTMRFIAVDVGLDYRVVERDGQPAIEFTFDGIDEGDRVSGRAWAVLAGDELRGRVFFHHGDDSSFTARRAAHVTPQTRT
jgi:hypothetical protein